MQNRHFVGVLLAVIGMRTILYVPVSQLEHSREVFVVVLERDVGGVFREDAGSLEELFGLGYFSDPG